MNKEGRMGTSKKGVPKLLERIFGAPEQRSDVRPTHPVPHEYAPTGRIPGIYQQLGLEDLHISELEGCGKFAQAARAKAQLYAEEKTNLQSRLIGLYGQLVEVSWSRMSMRLAENTQLYSRFSAERERILADIARLQSEIEAVQGQELILLGQRQEQLERTLRELKDAAAHLRDEEEHKARALAQRREELLRRLEEIVDLPGEISVAAIEQDQDIAALRIRRTRLEVRTNTLQAELDNLVEGMDVIYLLAEDTAFLFHLYALERKVACDLAHALAYLDSDREFKYIRAETLLRAVKQQATEICRQRESVFGRIRTRLEIEIRSSQSQIRRLALLRDAALAAGDIRYEKALNGETQNREYLLGILQRECEAFAECATIPHLLDPKKFETADDLVALCKQVTALDQQALLYAEQGDPEESVAVAEVAAVSDAVTELCERLKRDITNDLGIWLKKAHAPSPVLAPALVQIVL